MLIQLHCATQGASIAYTFESGDTPHWRLYTQPLWIDSGMAVLRARAIRIGYRESKDIRINITA
ncbi:MAG: chitobiase/beta-hexosaminidase C-terminal domain-containing protein [Lentisphaerae bacterium]|nr:chitobiase/beta-hexosaminidase C-terminal domain-containing protein [Lentisphaerota bacterium]